ncbi:MAG: hypothetical protein ABW321_06320, partial [Polyangiales bacterium]
TGRLDACARRILWRPLSARVCAGLAAGALYARGHGQVDPRSVVLGYFAFVNTGGAALTLSQRWSIDIQVSLIWSLRRLSVGVTDRSGRELEARALPPVGFVLGLGPSYHF